MENRYFAVNGLQLASWKAAYGLLDVECEINKMVAWLDANPKRQKRNYKRFVVGWLNRAAQEEGQRIKDSRAAASVGRNDIETGGSKLVGGMRYSADDLAWHESMGIKL
jgi:hypothetical protein